MKSGLLVSFMIGISDLREDQRRNLIFFSGFVARASNQRADPLRRRPQRVVQKMCVSSRCLGLSVAEQGTDDG